MRLILFDIDGTLIHSNRAGRAALVFALEETFGTAGPIDKYQMAGKTDPLIITELLQAEGIGAEEIEAGMDLVYERMAERGQTIFSQFAIRPCRGVPELLGRLQEEEQVILGLVTGNNRLTAPLKLLAAGISPLIFGVAAYGSDAKDRNLLTQLALERARDERQVAITGDETVVVGDTPADILSARAAGAMAVAVATGVHSASTLAEYNPDALLRDLSDTNTALEVILNGQRIVHEA